MSEMPNCPECDSSLVYEYAGVFTCPECTHEWSGENSSGELKNNASVICDANGSPLEDGDSVVVIKDLKVKGSSSIVKMGTKVKNIRLVEGEHDIDCKIPGIGAMGLKSEFVKKVSK